MLLHVNGLGKQIFVCNWKNVTPSLQKTFNFSENNVIISTQVCYFKIYSKQQQYLEKH